MFHHGQNSPQRIGFVSDQVDEEHERQCLENLQTQQEAAEQNHRERIHMGQWHQLPSGILFSFSLIKIVKQIWTNPNSTYVSDKGIK